MPTSPRPPTCASSCSTTSFITATPTPPSHSQRTASSATSMHPICPHAGCRLHIATATATTATNGAAARQAHPLSAPPLSRDDSSMEIEVENLLPTTSEHPAGHTDHTNGHSNGASRPDQSRAQDELADAELASDIDDAEDDLDVDISPDLTADDLRGVRARKQIKDYIIAGHIRQAMDMINTHFPTVLNSTAPTASTATSTAASNGSKSSRSKAASTTSTATTTTTTGCEKVLPANPTSMEPDHLLLNLQIQVFIEAIRSASTSQLASATNGAASAASPQMGPCRRIPLARFHHTRYRCRSHLACSVASALHLVLQRLGHLGHGHKCSAQSGAPLGTRVCAGPLHKRAEAAQLLARHVPQGARAGDGAACVHRRGAFARAQIPAPLPQSGACRAGEFGHPVEGRQVEPAAHRGGGEADDAAGQSSARRRGARAQCASRVCARQSGRYGVRRLEHQEALEHKEDAAMEVQVFPPREVKCCRAYTALRVLVD
ncbi:hypothetical protein L1887_56479 [Cichorium endivia]|nr:hypothetical protein L1887_56479 [Cichorium endivia]